MQMTESVWHSPQPLTEPTALTQELTLSQPCSTLVFLDTSVSDYHSLIAASAGAEVYVLDPSQDAIAQITRTLQSRTGISSLQILSHGQAGGVQLGASWLNATTLDSYSAQLQSWAASLTAEADILLYGCNTARGTAGQAFIQKFAQLTQADVAASDDLTGYGGDWDLEATTGAIASISALDATARSRYAYSLAPTVVLYDGNGNPASGNWLAYQDATQVAGGSAQVSSVTGGVRLTTDTQAYAGFSNYTADSP